jgi:gamma-glutamyl:cysteine ligase YbdK (ATP-grasp superfamily)
VSLPLRLFEGVGVELEYMIVERDSLRVLPICDRLMAAVAGAGASDHEDGAIAWSNELVLHVLEFKTNGPAPALAGLAAEFQRSIRRANELLRTWSATLLPGGVHPTMDPVREMQLWPHESGPIYQAYDRIFGCRGHGWANLQSCHLNLPFRGDQEFTALHSAVRAVLPVLPALAAASPCSRAGSPASATAAWRSTATTSARSRP